MKKRRLLSAALALSLLVCSGCTGGKTNGDGSGAGAVSTPVSSSASASDGTQSTGHPPQEPAPEDPILIADSGTPLDEETKALCRAAVNYCEHATGHRPGVVRIDSVDEEGVTLQLYDDMGDHTATCAWYTIDPATLEGSDIITGEEIAFYSYMDPWEPNET